VTKALALKAPSSVHGVEARYILWDLVLLGGCDKCHIYMGYFRCLRVIFWGFDMLNFVIYTPIFYITLDACLFRFDSDFNLLSPSVWVKE